MEKKKSGSSLYFLAGILFIASAAVGGNYAFYAIGLCFIVLGYSDKKKNKKEKPEEEKHDNQ